MSYGTKTILWLLAALLACVVGIACIWYGVTGESLLEVFTGFALFVGMGYAAWQTGDSFYYYNLQNRN